MKRPQVPNPSLSASSYDEAKTLAKLFEESLVGTEAWLKVRHFMRFMELKVGQMALSDPPSAEYWAAWQTGMRFMLSVVEGAIQQVDEYEQEEEDPDTDLIALSALGEADPL